MKFNSLKGSKTRHDKILGNVKDDGPDPWSPLRQKVGEDLKETYLKEVQQFLDRGKSQHYA